jgi:glutamine amidotransferase
VSSAVTVVDYGIGNLYSVQRALECVGARVSLCSRADDIESASHLLLPGVGAFADGMAGLRERGLIEPIRRYAASGRSLLGICLGMQMLATASDEFGNHQGLNLVPGRVIAVPSIATDGLRQKVPHVGWVELQPHESADSWTGSVLEGTEPGTAFYLVHSYALVPNEPSHRLADCNYGGHVLCAAVKRGNVHGVQFHPEKSGPAGLAMLARFVAS